MKIKTIILLCLSGVLMACGGGGGSVSGAPSNTGASDDNTENSGGNTPGPLEAVEHWSSLMRSDPQDLNTEQRKAAYWGAALAEYQGSLDPAELNYEVIYQMWLILNEYLDGYLPPVAFYGEALGYLGVEAFDPDMADSSSQALVEVAGAVACKENGYGFIDPERESFESGDGSVVIAGELDDGVGTINVQLEQCNVRDANFSGVVFAEVQPLYIRWEENVTQVHTSGVQYFEAIAANSSSAEYSVTGFYERDDTAEDGGLDTIYEYSALVYTDSQNDLSFLRRIEEIRTKRSDEYHLTGALAIGASGSVLVDYEHHTRPEGAERKDFKLYTLTLWGEGGSRADLSTTLYGYTLLEIDEDGDGEHDIGRFFSDYVTSMGVVTSLPRFGAELDENEHPFVAASQLNYPPVLFATENWETYPSSENGAEHGISADYYFDNETPADQLEVTVVWTVNGVEIPEAENSPTLAPEYIEPGDYVTVVVGVSDGDTTVSTREVGYSARF